METDKEWQDKIKEHYASMTQEEAIADLRRFCTCNEERIIALEKKVWPMDNVIDGKRISVVRDIANLEKKVMKLVNAVFPMQIGQKRDEHWW